MNENAKDLRDYPSALNVTDVSEILRICTKTVYRMIREGQLPVVRVGKKILVPKKELYSYLQRNCRPC